MGDQSALRAALMPAPWVPWLREDEGRSEVVAPPAAGRADRPGAPWCRVLVRCV